MDANSHKEKLLQDLMHVAIEEAKASLREGNSGFGAVIAKNGEIIARAHDTDNTDDDPTAHAEIKAIREASRRLGRNLQGCLLVATHEPCPMCATAALWAGIDEVGFGYSIKDAIKQGRRRIDLPLLEIYSRAGKEIMIHDSVLPDHCSLLYNRAVRDQIAMLRGADGDLLKRLADEKCRSRVQWFRETYRDTMIRSGSILDDAYRLFLTRLGITAEEAPIVRRSKKSITIHSSNFCPTLEACTILRMDTRSVCLALTEDATTELLRELHPRLRFSRNYDKIRPYAAYCEETITLETS